MSKIPFNKTKIIATVGPASRSKPSLKRLINAGTDVFRLNFSHGSHEDHAVVLKRIRDLNEELNTNICVLQDLQGPKIRVNEVKAGTKLKAGHEFIITTKKTIGDAYSASTTYQALPKDVKPKDRILIDDGKIELEVVKTRKYDVVTEVIHGGKLKSRKGINLPQTIVSAPSLTEKDHEDLLFGLENNIEWIALSFVRRAADVLSLKKMIADAGKDCLVIAKIEKPEAVNNIDEIIEAADAIMVARGDLGVEIPLEDVPIIQKQIVIKCKNAAKPVIIATQMMESMIDNPRPTRAETNDVANAVFDGADTLMLSGETAVGAFPESVIKIMVRTIAAIEKQSVKIYHNHYPPVKGSFLFFNDTVILNACQLAMASDAKAITGMTHKGYAAFKLASHRPKAHIFIFSSNTPFLNTMNLIWGVRGIYYNSSVSTDDTISDIERILREKGFVEDGETFISTASMPIHDRGRTNMVKINCVGE